MKNLVKARAFEGGSKRPPAGPFLIADRSCRRLRRIRALRLEFLMAREMSEDPSTGMGMVIPPPEALKFEPHGSNLVSENPEFSEVPDRKEGPFFSRSRKLVIFEGLKNGLFKALGPTPSGQKGWEKTRPWTLQEGPGPGYQEVFLGRICLF